MKAEELEPKLKVLFEAHGFEFVKVEHRISYGTIHESTVEYVNSSGWGFNQAVLPPLFPTEEELCDNIYSVCENYLGKLGA